MALVMSALTRLLFLSYVVLFEKALAIEVCGWVVGQTFFFPSVFRDWVFESSTSSGSPHTRVHVLFLDGGTNCSCYLCLQAMSLNTFSKWHFSAHYLNFKSEPNPTHFHYTVLFFDQLLLLHVLCGWSGRYNDANNKCFREKAKVILFILSTSYTRTPGHNLVLTRFTVDVWYYFWANTFV